MKTLAQMLGISKPAAIAPQRSMQELFNGVAKAHGLTTISQPAPDGGCLVWVTKDETDPMKALLSAALSIMVRRGLATDSDKGVSIRKVMGVVAPGCDYYWKVTDNAGTLVAEGYAVSTEDAATQMSKHLLPNL